MPLVQFRVEAWQAAGMEELDRRAFRVFRANLDKCRVDAQGGTQGEEPAVHPPGLAGSLAPARKILADLASIAKQEARREGSNPSLPEDPPPVPKCIGRALNALPASAARPSAEMDDFTAIWTAPAESRAMGISQMGGGKTAQPARHTRITNMLASTAAPSSAHLEDFGIAPPAPIDPHPVMDRVVPDAREISKAEKAKPGISIGRPDAERTTHDSVPGRRLRLRKRPPA